jgi:RHS repeat-associated protein
VVTLLSCPLARGQGTPQESSISPEAGDTYPWEAGLQVSTYTRVNLFNGNALTTIPIVSWPAFGPDMDFRLYHNSSAVGSGERAPAPGGFFLGEGWTFSYGGQLVFDGVGQVTLIEDDGLLNVYEEDDPDWVPQTGIHDTLEEISSFPDPINVWDLEWELHEPAWLLTRKNQWQRVFDENGRLMMHTDGNREIPMPIVVDWVPDDHYYEWYRGKIDKIRDATACRLLQFHYDSSNDYRLEYIATLNAGTPRFWVFSYDETKEWMNGITLVVDSTELWTISFEYDEDGRITSITDREGNTTTFAYDDDDRLETVTDPIPSGTPYTQGFEYEEYSLGPPYYGTVYADRRGEYWTFKFHNWGGLRTLIDPLTNQTDYTYDSDYNLTSVTDAEARTWSGAYDSSGNLLTVEDPLGHLWEWTYDAYNNVTTITPPLDDEGNGDTSKTIEFVYEDMYEDEYEYQYMADYTHVTEILEPADGEGNGIATTLLSYYHHHGDLGENEGEIRSVLDANGVETIFTYLQHDGTLHTWTEGPSAGGGEDYPVEYEQVLNSSGFLVSAGFGHAEGTTDYDDNGNALSGTCAFCNPSPIGCGMQSGYVVDPPAPHIPVLDFDYTRGDDPALPLPMPGCTDGCGQDCCWEATHDLMDNPLTQTFDIKYVSGVDWDKYNDQQIGSAFTYETGTRVRSWTYDELYRLVASTIETDEPYDNIVTRTFEYEYDGNGNLITLTDPEDVEIEYHYDDANHLDTVCVSGGTETLVDYDYHDDGRLASADLYNGVGVGWTYDGAGRLDEITYALDTTVLLAIDYDWTPDGLVESIATTDGSESYTVDFEYDKRGRLITEKIDDGPTQRRYHLTYTYDQLGNRLTKTDVAADPDVITTYHYDTDDDPPFDYETRNNRLMYYEVEQDSTLLETTWFAYDGVGQIKRIVRNYPESTEPDLYYVTLLQYTGGQLVWLVREFTCEKDGSDEPINITAVAGWQYRYDGDPRARYLVRAIDPETMEELGENPGDGSVWHDYAGAAIRNDLHIDDQGAVTVLRAYTQGLGLIESTDVVGDERVWYHGDMLGTTRLMTDEAGAADHRLRFTAFGEPLPLGGYGDPPGAPPQLSTRYGFAGSWGYQHDALTSGTDAPADLLHVGYRWYNPSIGRFIQRDPIGLLGGLNAYPYAFNSPTGRVDPDGRLSLGRMLIVAGTGAVIMTAALTAWEYFSALGNDALDNFNVYNDLIDRDLRINSGDPAFGNRVPIGDIKEAVGGIARTCPGLTTTGRPTPADTPEEGALEVLPHLIPGTRDD